MTFEYLYDLADTEWRKINRKYESYSSDDFLVMYDLFIEAFIKGYREKESESD
jgi:hypothetical protein